MSLTPPLPYRSKTFLFESGERRAFLVNESGVPEPYSTLYVTSKIRNASKGLSSQEGALGAINLLYAHLRTRRLGERTIDVVQLFQGGKVLDAVECEALRRAVECDYSSKSKNMRHVISLGKGKRGHQYAEKSVGRKQQYDRLTYIAQFLEWLGTYFADNKDPEFLIAVGRMVQSILAQRPEISAKGEDESDRSSEFTREHYRRLAAALKPNSPENPFVPQVQLRNLALLDLLSLLGERKGAALNIRVGDIDWGKRQLHIIRRAGSKVDRRVRQPRVKTLEHTVPIGPGLMRVLEDYRTERRTIPGARTHPYFFVVHKPGPTQGQAMTISSLNAVFGTINEKELGIPRLHPHMLRSFNGNSLADLQQEAVSTEQSRETDRRVRNNLHGRRPESPIDAVYVEHATRRAAEKVSIQHQQALAASDPKREAQIARIAESAKIRRRGKLRGSK